MPIYREIAPGIREVHTAERLQVSFVASGEDVDKMQFQVFFTVQIQKVVSGSGDTAETIDLGPPYIDLANPLFLSPASNHDVRFAAQIFQQEIGTARHAQLHTPLPEPEPDPLVPETTGN